jgi:hypothetical protein
VNEPVGEPKFVLRYVMTADELVAANRLFNRRIYRLQIAGGVVLLVAGVAASLVSGDPATGFGLVVGGALITFLATVDAPTRWLTRRRARSILGSTIELRLGKYGLAYLSELTSGETPWSALSEIRDDGKTILFLRDRILVAFAPASAFASNEQRQEVIAYARRQIAEGALERTAPGRREGE